MTWQNFVWKLLDVGFFEKKIDEASIFVQLMYEEMESNCPKDLEDLLVSFWSSCTYQNIVEIAKYCVINSVFIVEANIRIVSYLIRDNLIDDDFAVHSLDFNGVPLNDLELQSQKIANQVWKIKQDRDFGIYVQDDYVILKKMLVQIA